jgi:hypothetical protein
VDILGDTETSVSSYKSRPRNNNPEEHRRQQKPYEDDNFWDIAPYNILVYRRFRVAYFLHMITLVMTGYNAI